MVWEVAKSCEKVTKLAKLVSLSVINSVCVSTDVMWHGACAGWMIWMQNFLLVMINVSAVPDNVSLCPSCDFYCPRNNGTSLISSQVLQKCAIKSGFTSKLLFNNFDEIDRHSETFSSMPKPHSSAQRGAILGGNCLWKVFWWSWGF